MAAAAVSADRFAELLERAAEICRLRVGALASDRSPSVHRRRSSHKRTYVLRGSSSPLADAIEPRRAVDGKPAALTDVALAFSTERDRIAPFTVTFESLALFREAGPQGMFEFLLPAHLARDEADVNEFRAARSANDAAVRALFSPLPSRAQAAPRRMSPLLLPATAHSLVRSALRPEEEEEEGDSSDPDGPA